MAYLFTSESVSEGHPDKVSDQISDALLDQFLAYDDKARCAIETFVTTGQVVIMGEVHSDAYIDLQTIARKTIKKIGYTKSEYQFDGDSCGILTSIHEQSVDINRGVYPPAMMYGVLAAAGYVQLSKIIYFRKTKRNAY